MLVVLIVIILVFCLVVSFLQLPKFGRKPTGYDLKRLKASPNYGKRSFENRSYTPDLAEGVTYFSVLKDYFLTSKKRSKPEKPIPSVKTDLKNLEIEEDILVWFGHSSYFIQADGKTILMDPVFSGSASPLPGSVKAFAGTDVYSVEDLPDIDYLFISHDHWDHLDYKTILELQPKVRTVICGLGVAAHFKRWGYENDLIIEKDWDETFELASGFNVNTVTARHFSGRGLKRNRSLWMSYALKTPNYNLFLGGDSGYDSHFEQAGIAFGPFDLAILENGQYDKSWKYIHMMPDEVLKAAQELKASRLFPVHSGKFALANHDWDTPLKEITAANESVGLTVATPKIGELVYLNTLNQVFDHWWEMVG